MQTAARANSPVRAGVVPSERSWNYVSEGLTWWLTHSRGNLASLRTDSSVSQRRVEWIPAFVCVCVCVHALGVVAAPLCCTLKDILGQDILGCSFEDTR